MPSASSAEPTIPAGDPEGPSLPLEPAAPWLPDGRTVEVPERGEVFVREAGEPSPRPPVVLLHGWGVTSDLNFFPAFAALAERHHVLSFDHQGYARGLPVERSQVRLTACADDTAAVLDALGIDRAVLVGYSMGGAVAQLTWRRHPERVAGLVLASTSSTFQGGPLTDLSYRAYTPLSHLARVLAGPAGTFFGWRVDRRAAEGDHVDWGRAELRANDPAALLSSLRSIGRFRSVEWLPEIDAPTAVVVTSEDRVVPPRLQRQLADAIPDARRFDFEGPHDSIVTRSPGYVPVLVDAVDAVVERAEPSDR